MRENLTGNRRLIRKLHDTYHTDTYPVYDNYPALEVPYTDAIPSDYMGVMGVPVTFMSKYNPEQFDIVAFRKGVDGRDLTIPTGVNAGSVEKKGLSNPTAESSYVRGNEMVGYPFIDGRGVYRRMFIRLRVETDDS